MKPPRPIRPWWIAAQIYGLALLTLLVAAIAVILLSRATRRTQQPPQIFDHFVLEVAAHARDLPAAQAAADRLTDHLGDEIALFTWDGDRLVASRGSNLAALPPDHLAALRRGDPHPPGPPVPDEGPVVAVTVDDPGTFVGYGLVRLRNGPPPGPGLATFVLVLGILGLVSIVVARRLARPLRRLLTTAQAFGHGDLRARVALPPRGALGTLGAVFDEMAGRVAHLLQAQRELLANVSHELRTPLARLRVALELAVDSPRPSGPDGADGPAARDELRAAEEDLGQLERMVEDVLRVASLDLAALQPETREAATRRVRLDLAALAERTTRRFAHACPERQVDITAPDDPLWVDADAELIRRALDNLLDNARKYSDRAAPIAVRVAADDASAIVTVVDAGVGIDPADQPHVFTPFFRTDRSRARGTGGVGLGLTLVQRIVVAHGGAVALASAPGRGTTITLTLPRASRQPEALAETTREA